MPDPTPISPRRRRGETPERSAGRGGVARPLTLTAIASTALLTACAERHIRVTSTPPGARVWLNDQEIGRTPATASFTFYGRYDLRIEAPGHEPYHATHHAKAPLHEYPGPDLIAEALPTTIDHTIEWHIELSPTPEAPEAVRAGLIDRAATLREQARSDSDD